MLKEGKRKLATIREISEIQPIPEADAIEVATVGGWKCVIKKGAFKVGDKAVYIEIDSLLPTNREEFNFLKPNKQGLHRLRTLKLRGQLSQGLLIPPPSDKTLWNDLDSYYGITKYEVPEELSMQGDIYGVFPSFIPKTDLERVQNLLDFEGLFEVSAKMDGTSLTCYRYENHFGVCGRNWEKKESDSCVYWTTVKKLNLHEKLPEGFAIQGEVVGPKIQSNRGNYKVPTLLSFDVYDINGGSYLETEEMLRFLFNLGMKEENIVYQVGKFPFSSKTIKEHLIFADSIATRIPGCEGLACKSSHLRFKVISNEYLLKIKE